MQSSFLILSTECDSNCRFCFYQQTPELRRQKSMSHGEFKKIVYSLKQQGLAYLYLTGGEPTIVKDINMIIETAALNRITTLVLSNGLHVNHETIKRLRSSGLDIFVLSLNPLWERGSTLKLQGLVETLKTSFEGRTSGIFVFTKANYKTLPRLIDWIEKVDFGTIIQPAYIPSSSPDKEELCPYELDDEAWRFIDGTAGEFLRSNELGQYWELVIGLREPNSIKRPPSYCPMGTETCVVDADGSTYPCFHRRDLLCGNILSDPLERLIQNLDRFGASVSDAHCFGRHCVSLFTHHA